LKDFVLNPFASIPSTANLLIINGIKDFDPKEAKYVFKEFTQGATSGYFLCHLFKMYFVRFTGSGRNFRMNGQLLQEDKVYPFQVRAQLCKGYKNNANLLLGCYHAIPQRGV